MYIDWLLISVKGVLWSNTVGIGQILSYCIVSNLHDYKFPQTLYVRLLRCLHASSFFRVFTRSPIETWARNLVTSIECGKRLIDWGERPTEWRNPGTSVDRIGQELGDFDICTRDRSCTMPPPRKPYDRETAHAALVEIQRDVPNGSSFSMY